MAKSQEVSNKTLLILIVAVTVVTIVSTWFIVDTVFNMNIAEQGTDETGQVSLTITEPEDSVAVSEDYEESVETSEEEDEEIIADETEEIVADESEESAEELEE